MRYVTLFLGVLAIFVVTVIHFYPEELETWVEKVFYKKDYIIAKPNDYFLEGNFNYIENYTDDVSNKEELLQNIKDCIIFSR